MAIGLACGSMNFILAIVTGIVVWLILVFFRKFEIVITRASFFMIVDAKADSSIMKEILSIATRLDCEVENVTTELINKNGEDIIEVTFKVINKNNLPVNVEEFKKQLFDTKIVVNIETPNMH